MKKTSRTSWVCHVLAWSLVACWLLAAGMAAADSKPTTPQFPVKASDASFTPFPPGALTLGGDGVWSSLLTATTTDNKLVMLYVMRSAALTVSGSGDSSLPYFLLNSRNINGQGVQPPLLWLSSATWDFVLWQAWAASDQSGLSQYEGSVSFANGQGSATMRETNTVSGTGFNLAGSPVAGDLVGNGSQQVLFPTTSNQVHAYETNPFGALSGWPISADKPVTNLAIGDFGNGTQALGLAVGSSTSSTFTAGADGQKQTNASVSIQPQGMLAGLAVADITGDGVKEQIFFVGNAVFAFPLEPGTPALPGWPFIPGNGNPKWGPIVGKGEDGKMEIIIITNTDYTYCLNPDGSVKWSKSNYDLGASSDLSVSAEQSIAGSPIAADVNGDGLPEILFSRGTEVVVLTSQGLVLNGPGGSDSGRYDTGAALTSSPVVLDVDGDGYLDICVAGSKPEGGAWFWAWPTTTVAAGASLPWPMEGLNSKRNPVFP